MTPVYMIKDGERHFMWNKRSPGDRIEEMNDKERTVQLVANDGMFITFHSPMPPLDLLMMFARRKLALEKSCIAGKENIRYESEFKCWTLAGNTKEVSAAFHFRIYDKRLAEIAEKAIRAIKSKSYDEAIKVLEEVPKNIARFAGGGKGE